MCEQLGRTCAARETLSHAMDMQLLSWGSYVCIIVCRICVYIHIHILAKG